MNSKILRSFQRNLLFSYWPRKKPQVFWLVENSEFVVGHEKAWENNQLLSYLLRNKPRVTSSFLIGRNSEFDVGHEESVRKKQLLSYLLRNKPRVFLLVKNLQFWFCTSEILLGNASRKNVKQAGSELCQAQQSLSLDLDTN